MKLNQTTTFNIGRMLLALAVALCVPASVCFATTESSLTTAIRHKNLPLVNTILSEGADVNERDEGAEQTPLMWAVQAGDIHIVRSLINHKAAVNIKDDDGKTALAMAREKGLTKIAALLVENGAKSSVQAGPQRNPVSAMAAMRRPVLARVSGSIR